MKSDDIKIDEKNLDIQDEKKEAKSMAEQIACKAKHAAAGAVESLKSAKDYVTEKVSKPGELVEEVKAWGADKAQAADGLLDRIEQMVVKVGDTLAQLREFVAEKADKVDRTLESTQGVLANAETTLGQAHDWAREKAAKLGDVMDKSREAIERSADRLAAQTEELRVKSQEALDRAKDYTVQAREEFAGLKDKAVEKFEEVKESASAAVDIAGQELRSKIDNARKSIKDTEFKLRQMGIDPEGLRMYGTSNPEAQVLREQLMDEEQRVSDYEADLRRSKASLKGPQIVVEKH